MSWIKYLFGQSFKQEYYTKGVITMLLSLVAGLVLINSYILIGVLGVIGYFMAISYRIIYTMLKSVSYGDKRIMYDNPNYRYVLDGNGLNGMYGMIKKWMNLIKYISELHLNI